MKKQKAKKLILFLVLILSVLNSCRVGSDSNDQQGTPTGESFEGAAFYDDFNGPEVDREKWLIATWVEHLGQTGLERCYTENGYLNLIFRYDSSEGRLSAAIQTREEFLYGRWEARLKPSFEPGIVNAFYTIDWDDTTLPENGDGTKQEIDIEFLTYTFYYDDPRVHFAVHEDPNPSFATNPDLVLDFDPSADFHIWGFDITPEYIEWFVDDQVLHRYTYAGNSITINAPYILKMNTWSSGSAWVAGPYGDPPEDVNCVFQIDWVRFTPFEE